MYTLKLTDEQMAALRFIVEHEGDGLVAAGIARYPTEGAHDRVTVRALVEKAEPDKEPAWKIDLELTATDDGDLVLVDTFAVSESSAAIQLGKGAVMTEDDANHLMRVIADAGLHA